MKARASDGVEIIINYKKTLRQYKLSATRLRYAKIAASLLVGASLFAILGLAHEHGKRQAAEVRIAKLEQELSAANDRYQGMRDTLISALNKSEEIGRTIGILYLAFDSLFDRYGMEAIEKERPEILTFRVHLEEIAERSSIIRRNLENIAATINIADFSSGAEASTAVLLDVVRNANASLEQASNMLIDFQPSGKTDYADDFRNAVSQLAYVSELVGELEKVTESKLQKERKDLFGGEIPSLCLYDLDRKIVSLVETHRNTLIMMSNTTSEIIELMNNKVESAELDAASIFGFSEYGIDEATVDHLDAGKEAFFDLSDKFLALPISHPLDEFAISSGFGIRNDPFTQAARMHKGIDFVAPVNTPIRASAPGRVIHAGAKGAYGLTVEIDHGAGFVTRFAHLNKTSVKKGDEVGRDTVIGELGTTGRSTGPHLHYEVLSNGTQINPAKFISLPSPGNDCDIKHSS